MNRVLSRAVRLTLGAASGALLASYTPISSAQDTSLGDVTVTGSRIPRPDLDSASPVTVLTNETIETSGVTDIGDLLQRLPSMSGSPIGTTTNNGGNGSVTIDLRGMGADRTVTLVNGKRTVDGGDYQTIPANMIERVEVLKDGGASVYGADAVAGVVNIITRSGYDGLELSAQTADFFDMESGVQTTFGLVAGKTFEGGHFTFGAEYVDQEEAYQRDAPWDFFQNSYYTYPQGCENQVTAPYDGTPQGGCYIAGSSRIPEGRLRFIAGGTNRTIINPGTGRSGVVMNVDGSGIVPYDGRVYNYAPVNYIQTPYERSNVFLDGRFAVTDSINFSASIRGNFRQSAQELAPTPYNSPTDPAYQGVFNGVPYSGISEQNYYLRQAIIAFNASNPAGAPDLAFEPISDARRRMEEAPRRFTQDITQYQVNLGLDGGFGNGIKWDVFYNWGQRERTDHDFGQYFGAAISNALGPSADLDGDGSPECYGNVADPTTIIDGCVPLNMFGGPLSVTQEMLGYIGVQLTDTFLTTQDEAAVTFSGELFDMPAGKLGWAAGYTYGKVDFEYQPDSGKATGTVTGNTGAGTSGSLENNSVFAEFLAPLFDNGTQSLDMRAAVRWDDYDAFASETTWSAGVEFNAMADVKLRATYGTVFRAPTIGDLYGGIIDSFPTYTDPCDPPPGGSLPPGCAQAITQVDSQLLALVGGNPNLIPETGETLTAGVVWAPQLGNGDLSLTVDYWKIELDDGISSLGVQFILNDCYVNQSAESCALVFRAPDYSIDHVIDTGLNLASQGAEGIDAEVRYAWDTTKGKFEVALLWSHLLERTKTPFPGAPEQELSSRYTDPTAQDGGAYAEDKANYSFKWFWNDLVLGYSGEYISALDSDTFFFASDYTSKMDAFLYHDLFAQYGFKQGTKLTVGVTNLTDEEPPYTDIGFNARTDPPTYRLFGRGYFVRLVHSFE